MVRWDGAAARSRPDTLAVEEPLELRVHGRALTVTMRTPGDDMDLAAGFLVSEGAVSRTDQLLAMRFCAGADGSGTNSYNVLDIDLAVAPPPARASNTTSSCGICGVARSTSSTASAVVAAGWTPRSTSRCTPIRLE